MEGGNEKRFAIKFCFKAGLSARETLVFVQKFYVNEALNRSNVFRWYSRFLDGKELVDDDERGLFVCLFSWRYNTLRLYFHSPVAGFGFLVFEVS